ncbi:MAG: FAD-dependent oxidoreductase [Chloroflexota bacterium]
MATHLLRRDSQLKIALIEKDLSYEFSSTVLSDGNSRVQFNVKENIQMSLYALEVLKTFAEEMAVDGEKPEIGFRQQGNLFLTDEAGRAEVEAGLALQQSLGGEVAWLTPEEAKAVYPLLNTEDGLFVGATLAAKMAPCCPRRCWKRTKRRRCRWGRS